VVDNKSFLKKIIFSLLLLPIYSFSQIDLDELELANSIKSICQKKDIDLHRAHHYFFKQQIDSSFFYSSKASQKSYENTNINDYVNYMYGISAVDKGFLSIAQEKLEAISVKFKYSHLVKIGLASIALEKSEFKKALGYYRIINLGEIKSNIKLKKVYHNIGLCHLHLKEYSKAEIYLKKELKLSKKDNDTISSIYAIMDLGNLFYQQYKDAEAITFFKDAYDLAQQSNDLYLKQLTAENMAVVEKNRKRFKESISYYEEYNTWKDSLWNRDQISKLLEKDKQIAIAIKDKAILIQKNSLQQQKKQLQWMIIATVTTLLFLGTLIYFYKLKTQQNKLIIAQKKKLEQLNTTKNYLFSVLSHDLRSSVNTLKKAHEKLDIQLNKAQLENSKKTVQTTIALTASLSHLLNNVLHWSLEQNEQLLFTKKDAVLRPIIEHVVYDFNVLLSIKKIRLQLDLNASIIANIDVESLKIVLRNIIDNAIKYTPENGRISITTTIATNTTCCIEIKDTGKGLSPEQLNTIEALKSLSITKIDRSKCVGLGLLLCHTLIKKNNGQLAINSILDKGTTCYITLPLT